jgi:hypothetical protein
MMGRLAAVDWQQASPWIAMLLSGIMALCVLSLTLLGVSLPV